MRVCSTCLHMCIYAAHAYMCVHRPICKHICRHAGMYAGMYTGMPAYMKACMAYYAGIYQQA